MEDDAALDTVVIDAASELIWGHWLAGTTLPSLPDGLRPRTRSDGYAIQASGERRSPAPVAGWKIAATSEAGQAHIGVDGPMLGRIYGNRVHRSGDVVAFGANRMAVAEAEFCFLVGATLPPKRDPYVLDEVFGAVVALHLAIELPDSRYDDFATVGAPQLIADNACAHEFVLGPATTLEWVDMDLVPHRVTARLTTPGTETAESVGRGGNVLGDPRLAMLWAVNELSTLGVALEAGQFVSTGTCLTPLPIAPHVEVVADFGAMGQMSVRIAR